MATKRKKEDVSRKRKTRTPKATVATPEVTPEDVPVFVPDTLNVRGIDKKLLTREDMLELELMDARIKQTAATAALLALEADTLERDTILKLRRKRAMSKDMSEENISLVDGKSRLLNRLSEKYGVDFKSPDTIYDTETRVIDVVEEPPKRRKDTDAKDG